MSAVVYAPNGRMLVSGSLDGSVRTWDIATGQSLSTFMGKSPVLGLAVSPDLRTLVVRTADRTLKMFDVPTVTLRNEIKLGTPYP